MTKAADNEALVRKTQAELRAKGFYLGRVDGHAGPKTREAIRAVMRAYGFVNPPLPADEHKLRWPGTSDVEMQEFYGQPGDRSETVTITPPYPMVLAWDPSTPLSRIRCHRLIAEPLEFVLVGIRELGEEFIKQHELDEYGGCWYPRKMRNGTRWSTHAYGASIDLSPRRNGLHVRRPQATMPDEVLDLFEAQGATCLGRAIGRDYMHAQFTQWPQAA